jgi:hypothetical protein
MKMNFEWPPVLNIFRRVKRKGVQGNKHILFKIIVIVRRSSGGDSVRGE